MHASASGRIALQAVKKRKGERENSNERERERAKAKTEKKDKKTNQRGKHTPFIDLLQLPSCDSCAVNVQDRA